MRQIGARKHTLLSQQSQQRGGEYVSKDKQSGRPNYRQPGEPGKIAQKLAKGQEGPKTRKTEEARLKNQQLDASMRQRKLNKCWQQVEQMLVVGEVVDFFVFYDRLTQLFSMQFTSLHKTTDFKHRPNDHRTKSKLNEPIAPELPNNT